MKKWDVFISHASEDKREVASPLAQELTKAGLTVWLDAMELRLGDSLREKIDEGLAKCRFGVVILSHAFLSKRWTTAELNALFARETQGYRVILPVWHKIDQRDLVRKTPLIADRIAVKTSTGLRAVATMVIQRVASAPDSRAAKGLQTVLRKFNALLDCESTAPDQIRNFLGYHHPIVAHAVGASSRFGTISFLAPRVGNTSADFIVARTYNTAHYDHDFYIVCLSSLAAPQLSPTAQLLGPHDRDLARGQAAQDWFSGIDRKLFPMGEVITTIVCGRRDQISAENKRLLRDFNRANRALQIHSYDWLLEAAVTYLSGRDPSRELEQWSRLVENYHFCEAASTLEPSFPPDETPEEARARCEAMQLLDRRKQHAASRRLNSIRTRVIASGLATRETVDGVIYNMNAQEFSRFRGKLKSISRINFKPEAVASPK
jgi:hypothetical protein